MHFRRRDFLFGGSLFLAGCSTSPGQTVRYERHLAFDTAYADIYGPVYDEPYPVPAVDLRKVDPRFLRREVAFNTLEPVGTIIVDTSERFAYYNLGGGRAIRYGVGVGREESLNFQGEAKIGRKAKWPRWVPTQDMIRRDPERYTKYADGMDGGPMNPLGARALYLYANGHDTQFRLHGTVEPWSIGKRVSSGCIRFLNQDIIDLYNRTPVGTRVIVIPTRLA